MSGSTRNSCCGLPDGQHRCQDLNCKRVFQSRDALDAHMMKQSHIDQVHNLNNALMSVIATVRGCFARSLRTCRTRARPSISMSSPKTTASISSFHSDTCIN